MKESSKRMYLNRTEPEFYIKTRLWNKLYCIKLEEKKAINSEKTGNETNERDRDYRQRNSKDSSFIYYGKKPKFVSQIGMFPFDV